MRIKSAKIMFNIYAALLGGIIFLVLYTGKVLNPTYDEWLLQGSDLTQHYVGWEAYRASSIKFPFGMTDKLAYPNKTSVMFTDSIPLFAVFFKLFNRWLPHDFQYFGLWGIMCFMLQAFFSAKILGKFGLTQMQILVGSIFFVVSPIVIDRMYRHTSLGGQWLILLCFWLFINHEKNYKDIIKTSIQWAVVGILTAGIHLYFMPMCGLVMAGYIICSLCSERKFKVSILLPGLAFAAGLLGTVYALGGFSSGAAKRADDFGWYSFNLNSFINPIHGSKILPTLDLWVPAQEEGYAYLGMGIILLIFAAIVYLVINIRKFKRKYIPAVISTIAMCGIWLMMALSWRITLGSEILGDIEYNDFITRVCQVFRSSGRMIWPIYYIIFFIAIICSCKLFNNKGKIEQIVAAMIPIVALTIQIYDISGILTSIHNRYSNMVQYKSEFQEGIWKAVQNENSCEHLICVSDISIDTNLQLAEYALDNDMTINKFYFARFIDLNENTENALYDISIKNMYVWTAEDKENAKKYNLKWYEDEKFIIGVVE